MNVNQHFAITRSAQFRFYRELNDFLPSPCCQTTFTHNFTGKPSIKDMIEAIGVPHVEVDLILVNDVSVDFNYHLKGEERIAVYPVFEKFDISPIVHLRSKPLRETKFVLDVHLGKLARYIRLLGFDTVYENDFDDETIIDISLRELRIILTRDIGILKHSKVTHAYWIRMSNSKKQLVEVVNHLQLGNSLKPFSRCALCNGLLETIAKQQLVARSKEKQGINFPEEVLQKFSHFTECIDCKKLYWRGSHYDRIKNQIFQDILNGNGS